MVDNGRDFRSRAFQRGCEDAGIDIDWRPPGEPRFGGHIERLIGTQMGKLHLLPGTTFSNPDELGDYDSRRHSAFTLRELERYIALDIVGDYHQSIHASLKRPPIAVWREPMKVQSRYGFHRTECISGSPSCPKTNGRCDQTASTSSDCDTGPPPWLRMLDGPASGGC